MNHTTNRQQPVMLKQQIESSRAASEEILEAITNPFFHSEQLIGAEQHLQSYSSLFSLHSPNFKMIVNRLFFKDIFKLAHPFLLHR
jgi:hypothetical protein